MDKLGELRLRHEMLRQRRELLGDALEAVRTAFETIKDKHERALLDEQAAMQELIEAMKKEQPVGL